MPKKILLHKLCFSKAHFYVIPLVCAFVWWAMLTAFLICWAAQGKPDYEKDHRQIPVYLSDVAATNLQPLFISCAGFQGIFFVGTLVLDWALRVYGKGRLQPYILAHQSRLGIAAIVCAILSQLAILMVAIFNTNDYHQVHMAMVGVFIVFAFFACACNLWISIVFGFKSSRLVPHCDRAVFGKSWWQNVYSLVAIIKLVWVLIAAVFAIIFGATMHSNRDISGTFEWILCYWYGILLILWSCDMFPSAVASFRRRHPELDWNASLEKSSSGAESGYAA